MPAIELALLVVNRDIASARYMIRRYVGIVLLKVKDLREKDVDKKLLFRVTIKDCVVSYYKGEGAGGQKRNKTMSGVRISHPPSGAVGQDCTTRSQHKNKRNAWRKMGESVKFQIWAKTRALGLEPLEDVVEKQMADENLKIEYGPFKKRAY